MNHAAPTSPWRWIAALSSVCGLAVLVLQMTRPELSPNSVWGASAMLVAGAALYVRLATSPERWSRITLGPEARRFFAISIACGLLLAFVAWVLMVRYLTTPKR